MPDEPGAAPTALPTFLDSPVPGWSSGADVLVAGVGLCDEAAVDAARAHVAELGVSIIDIAFDPR